MIADLLAKLQADPLVNAAVLGIWALIALDFLIGTLRSAPVIGDGSFKIEALTTFIHTNVLPAVLITLTLLFAQVIGSISVGPVAFNVLTATGLGSAATLAAVLLKSILDSINPSAPNPVPTIHG